MKFATETQIKIKQLLDGEPVKRYLPNLNGTESPSEILKQLKQLKQVNTVPDLERVLSVAGITFNSTR